MFYRIILFLFMILPWVTDADEMVEEVLDHMNVQGLLPKAQRVIEKVDNTSYNGAFTQALYCVTNRETHQSYILKEIPSTSMSNRPADEVFEQLHHVTNHFKIYENLEEIPTVIPVLATYKLNEEADKSRYFVLMPQSPGKVFVQWVTSFLGEDSPDISKIESVFQSLGKNLALWHIAGADWLEQPRRLSQFKTNYLHGDLHAGNMFFDGEKFYLIDIELIGKSLSKSKRIDDDIEALLFSGIQFIELFHQETSPSEIATILCALTSFLKGYISQFPAEAKAAKYLKIILRSVLREEVDSESQGFIDVDRDDIIDAIFEALE